MEIEAKSDALDSTGQSGFPHPGCHARVLGIQEIGDDEGRACMRVHPADIPRVARAVDVFGEVSAGSDLGEQPTPPCAYRSYSCVLTNSPLNFDNSAI